MGGRPTSRGGEIDWSAATGAHVVYGTIEGKHTASAAMIDAVGRPMKDVLGLPTSDEVATPGGRVVHVQGGDINWSAATGAHVVIGAIFDELNATATETDATGR